MPKMDDKKTMFAIFLMEDERGFVTIQADHYGPGMNSYKLGMSVLGHLMWCEEENPERIKVKPLAYLPRPQ